MQIVLRGPAAGYEAEHTARLFFPDAEKTENLPQDSDFVLAQSHLCTDTILLRLHGRLYWKIALRPQGADPEYTLCRLLYTLLGEVTGSTPPWGMMTGVRPVRIIHDMRASGATEDEIRARFLDHFACTPEKFAVALGIADLQKPVLDAADPMDCSVYAGIPFCPTRCSYCSFVSCNLDRDRKLVQPYVDCLCREVEAIRAQADKAGLQLCSIYIGGGTPTSLSADQLRQLMGTVRQNFDLSKLLEYTVEAGRPDCTDAEKLAVIKEYGATRISINPQTFSDQVLANIGRRHTAQDILDCYAQARAAGHQDINMDLIVGLPEETIDDVRQTMEEIKALRPDSVTVHSLAIKRAARLNIYKERYGNLKIVNTQEMIDLTAQYAEEMGLKPYYLYRQKNMAGNFENVGYAVPGKECLYNILIMEEKQTIAACGAGTTTKVYFPAENRIERAENVKEVEQYIDRIDEMIGRKEKLLGRRE